MKDAVSEFTSHLEALTAYQIFTALKSLEEAREDNAADHKEVLSRIVIVEVEIERHYPANCCLLIRT